MDEKDQRQIDGSNPTAGELLIGGCLREAPAMMSKMTGATKIAGKVSLIDALTRKALPSRKHGEALLP